MATRSRSARQAKRQSRLTFTPLPTSSPAKDEYSTAVQERLASVRYQGTKAQKARPRDVADVQAPLTPEPSSQLQRPLYVGSPPASEGSLSQSRNSQTGTLKGPSDVQAQEIEDEDEIVVLSSKRRKLSRSLQFETPTRKSTRLQTNTPRTGLSAGTRSKSQIGSAIASSPPLRRSPSIGSAETSGDEAPEIVSKPTLRHRAGRKAQQQDDPCVVPDDDDGELSDLPATTQRRRLHSSPSPRSRHTVRNDFIAEDDEVEFISHESDTIEVQQPTRKSKGKKLRSRRTQTELDDDLKDLVEGSSDQDVIEIEGTGVNGESTRKTRGGPVRTARDKTREHLALLKRRRAGERVARVIDSDSEDAQFNQEDGVDIENVVLEWSSPTRRFEGEEVSSESENEPDPTTNDFPDEDEDDFIVEDDESEAVSNRRPQSGIPLAFTQFASSRPRELFVHVIEWLVKNKIAPAFERNDEVYHLSWGKINDQIRAQAGSRLISAAWNEDFKHTLMARPELQIHHVSEGADELFLDCDACNRTGHPARYEFKLGGHSYHPDTLEPVNEDIDHEDDDEEDEELSDDHASYDAAGHLLPSSRVTFNLGRFCAANAEMGHKLTHWKFHLNQSLMTYLESQGVLSAENIVAREKMSKKKREKLAEEIVDNMEATGVVAEMWQDLQNDLEDARFGMEDHVSKKGRSKARIGKVRVNRGQGRVEEWSEGGRMTRLVVPSDSEGE